MNAVRNTENTLSLDPLLHQPVRTRLVAFIAARGEATFTELKTALAITDGNLDAHIKKLSSAGYLLAHKQHTTARPQTRYSLSRAGRKAFTQYVETLNRLLVPASTRDTALRIGKKIEAS